jgi:hypothetical protein
MRFTQASDQARHLARLGARDGNQLPAASTAPGLAEHFAPGAVFTLGGRIGDLASQRP